MGPTGAAPPARVGRGGCGPHAPHALRGGAPRARRGGGGDLILRRFRVRDTAEFIPLLHAEFPVEESLIGSNPDELVALIRRTYRFETRLLLGLLRLSGRRVFDFLVVEEDGHLVGTTLVTYLARAGVISTVAVDRRYRRRGFARALLARAHAEIRRSGRAYAVLQVLEENAPAQRLYRALGYRNLRASSVLFRDAPAPVPVPSLGSAELRPFRPSDASALAEIFNSQLPPEVRDVVPATTELFSPSPFLVRATRSESEAWVLANAGRPLGYVRATVGGISRSANLSQPVLAAEADAEASLALVGTALAWIRARGMARTVVEVPEGLTLARATLAAAGFVPGYALDTLVFDLPMA